MLVRAALLGTVLGCGSLVLAADDEIPEMDFVEYLGMWDGSDEDWLILDEPTAAGTDERTEPVPKGDVSAEKVDES